MATKVYCKYKDCKYCKVGPYYEEWGECTKDEIFLDEGAQDILFGCPDGEEE